MNFTDKQLNAFRGISLVAGIFTLLIAFTMLFTLIQLKRINPLENQALLQMKEQFDKDPDNKDKAEQLRAIDLMARRAYFSSRWQVETGSYLMLAGAIVFVIFQRLIAVNDKLIRTKPQEKPDLISVQKKSKNYLIISASVVIFLAIISSFVLRTKLPSPYNGAVISSSVQKPSESNEVSSNDDVNFPFFRGDGSRGIAMGKGFATDWNGSEGKNIKWKVNLPKSGKSSPVIWKDRIFITGAKDADLELYCLDKNTGKILWTGSGSDFQGASRKALESDNEAGMAVPTAAVNKDFVCAMFGNANLVCYDHEGKLIWGKNIGIPSTTYAFAASLLIYKETLIIQYDGNNKMSVIGLDLKNGDQKWETMRTGRAVNSSPVLASFDGQIQIIINGNPNVSAYDPESGKEIWSQTGVSGDVVPSVAVNSKMVFAVTDYAKLIALKPGKTESKVWEDNRFTPDVSSPVANEKYLFIATGNGDAACYDVEKGDTLWTHYFENPIYASPVLCDNKVWILDRNGIMHIVEAADRLKIIANSPLGENSDCTPVFSEKKIYIRGKENLYCIASD